MKFSSTCLAAVLSAAIAIANADAESGTCHAAGSCDTTGVPFVGGKITKQGKVLDIASDDSAMVLAKVRGCCGLADDSPVGGDSIGTFEPQTIGEMPQMSTSQTMEVLEDAKKAWNGGMGAWPQMSLKERVTAIEGFLEELGQERELVVTTLMWEIGKNRKDAEAEFDRTIQFCQKVIEVIRTDDEYTAGWQTIGSTKAFVRRAAVGIIMCLGPMNYPLNETYATLIPALLMGNVAIMKIPTVGGLAHLLTSKFSLSHATFLEKEY